MPPELVVTVDDQHPRTADELRSLRGWLSGMDDLRGRVRLRDPAARPGTLGAVADALLVVPPVVASLVPALISWIRSRHTAVDLTVTRPDGTSVQLSAQRLRRLGAEELGPEIERLVRSLGIEPPAAAPQAGATAALEAPGPSPEGAGDATR